MRQPFNRSTLSWWQRVALLVGPMLLLVPTASLNAQSPYHESLTPTVTVGVRVHHRNLKWEAASSRLTFVEKVVLPTVRFSLPLSRTDFGVWGVRGLISSGSIIGGDFDDREPHWKTPRHQIAEITGSGADEQEFAVFYRTLGPFGLDDFEVSIGWGRFRARRTLENGLSLRPREFVLENLDSRFRSTWNRINLGFAARIPVGGSHLLVEADVRRSDYEATGTWNLRPELRQPISYTQGGRGWGGGLATTYLQPLGPVTLEARAYLAYADVEDGDDRVFFADGDHAYGPLDRARFQHLGIEVAVTYSGH